jgi:hypothetical protein
VNPLKWWDTVGWKGGLEFFPLHQDFKAWSWVVDICRDNKIVGYAEWHQKFEMNVTPNPDPTKKPAGRLDNLDFGVDRMWP